MAETAYFFDGVSYAEADQAYVQRRFRRDGILWEAGSRLALSAPGGMFVRVADGEMMIQGFLYVNTTNKDLAIANNTSGNARIDRVVLHLDRNANTATIIVLTGTPSGSPVAPVLNNTSNIAEISLGTIAVANSALNIVTGNISAAVPVSNIVQYSQELAAGVVDNNALGLLSVATGNIQLLSVTGAQLSAGAINASSKFGAGVVDSNAIANHAVSQVSTALPSGSTASTTPVECTHTTVTVPTGVTGDVILIAGVGVRHNTNGITISFQAKVDSGALTTIMYLQQGPSDANYVHDGAGVIWFSGLVAGSHVCYLTWSTTAGTVSMDNGTLVTLGLWK